MLDNNIYAFLEKLGQKESSGNYKAINQFGFIGKYQMGEAALVDAGYYKPKSDYNNKWDGEFTGKDGVYSVEDFLNNPQAQENAIRIYQEKQWRAIKPVAQKYEDKYINGIRMTKSGMLAGAHLVGQGALKKYLLKEGEDLPKDGNGVSIEKYINDFSGYDVSEITNPTPKRQVEDKYLKSLTDAIMKKYFSDTKIYTREDIAQMTSDEFLNKENLIRAQWATLGIPTQKELNLMKPKTQHFSDSKDGKWVTINGNHVLIEK